MEQAVFEFTSLNGTNNIAALLNHVYLKFTSTKEFTKLVFNGIIYKICQLEWLILTNNKNVNYIAFKNPAIMVH